MDSTKKFYDDMFKNNPTRWDVPGGYHPFDFIAREFLVHAYGFNRHFTLIDLGCGNGRTLKFISELPFQMDAIGYDFSTEAIKLAKINCPSAHFYEGDMLHIPIKSGSFDVVLSVGSFEHQVNLDFSEPRRLISSSGWFICVLPDVEISKGITLAPDQKHYDWELTRRDWIDKIEPFGFKFVDYKHPWTFIFKPVGE